MDKIFNELYKNLHHAAYKDPDPLNSFLFSTRQHILLIFFITSQAQKQSTLEEICYNISPKVISRSTIQNILKEGVKINFFKKKINTEDKRAKYYQLTSSSIKLIEDWAYEQNKVFSNLNHIPKSK